MAELANLLIEHTDQLQIQLWMLSVLCELIIKWGTQIFLLVFNSVRQSRATKARNRRKATDLILQGCREREFCPWPHSEMYPDLTLQNRCDIQYSSS